MRGLEIVMNDPVNAANANILSTGESGGVISGNILTLNNGENGTGVTAGQAGLRIKRGNLNDYMIVFDEADDMLKVGVAGSLQTVATTNWVNTNFGATSTLSCASGTAAAPTFSFSSDTNTGIYSAGADAIGFTTGGTERMRLTSTNMSVSTHIVPSLNETYDLGSSNMRFRDLYLSGNTIFMGSNYSIGADSNTDTFTLLDRRTNQPAKLQASEIVLAGSTAQKVLRMDEATKSLKLFDRNVGTGVETEEAGLGGGSSGSSGVNASTITELPRVFSATAVATPEDNNWVSVCWSPQRGLFVAVAINGTGDRVMTSPDGVTWTARTSAAFTAWHSVCWSPELGLFVAVAFSGTGIQVMTSTDGITWTIRDTPADNQWMSVCWSPEQMLFVAVANTGTNRVMISTDGVNWFTHLCVNNEWMSVCWSPQRLLFVAVAFSGTGNRVMTSPNGVTWTARASAADNQWQAVCWSPERALFVAVATTGTNRVMTSPDGITWTTRTAAADNQWYSVSWAPGCGLFLAVADTGTGNQIMTSPDGITWTIRTSPTDNEWRGVCWSPEQKAFVAVAYSGTGNRAMRITFEPEGPLVPLTLKGALTNSSFVATARTTPADNHWTEVCWSPQRRLFVAVAMSGTGNRVMTSPDGVTWTARTSAFDHDWRSVCWSPELGIFVAVAYYTALAYLSNTNRVMTSPDGITWTARTSATKNQWFSVCWSPEKRLFVAVANSGTNDRVMTSPDGITWTTRTTNYNRWNCVCWSPEARELPTHERGLFVAVAGTGINNRVMTSRDGVTWTVRTSPDNNWLSVCWSPERGLFVAVAANGIGNRVMTSPDGITWTLRASAADFAWVSVRWAAQRGLFVAVASTGNRIMSSPDGVNWTLRASAADNAWSSVCYAPELDRFVAVAASGTGNRAMTMQAGQAVFVDMLQIGGSNTPTARLDIVPVVNQRVLRVGTASGGDAMVVESDGKVGIGITAPTHELDVAGTIRASGDVFAFSDCNYKYDVARINNALESVKVIKGYTYRLGEGGATRHAGVFAQEVEQVLPEVVNTDIDGKKSVAYGNMTGLLIEAIKELIMRVESLEKDKNV